MKKQLEEGWIRGGRTESQPREESWTQTQYWEMCRPREVSRERKAG